MLPDASAALGAVPQSMSQAGYSFTPSPAPGGGISGAMGGVGSLIQSLGGLGGSIAGLIQSTRESGASQSARHIWERAREPAGELLNNLFYNPAIQGKRVPYTNQTLNYAPRSAMKAVYAGFLNRQYGLPENIGRAMVAQSLQPLSVGQFRGLRPGSARVASKIDPGALAQAGLAQGAVTAGRQASLLKGAGQLSAFNLWRAQQLGELIG